MRRREGSLLCISVQLSSDSERGKWDHLTAPYKTLGCPGTFPLPSHKQLQRGAKWSQRAAGAERGRRQQQLRELHSFASTLIERSVLIFDCLLSLLMWSIFLHSANGPPPSLILVTIAPKSLLRALVSNSTALSPAHWDCTLGSQGRSLPCVPYLYGMRTYSRVTKPCCCNKHGKGSLTDGLGSWLDQSLQHGSQMPGSEPSSSRTSTHVESGELSIAQEHHHRPGKVLWSDAASGTAREITELIWTKASFTTET